MNNRYAAIDGLRACAALYVVLFHLITYVYKTVKEPVPLLLHPLNYGHYAVSLFIAISGFCLALPVIRHGMRLPDGFLTYISRRAIRILPPYAGAVLVSIIVLFATLPTARVLSVLFDSPALLSRVLMVQDFWDRHAFNGSLWSMAVEWRIYFLLPFILLLWRKTSWIIAVLVVSAVGIAISFLCLNTQFMVSCCHYLALFTLGVLGAWVSKSDHYRAQQLRSLSWISLFTAATLVFLGTAYACMVNGIGFFTVKNWLWADLLVGIMSMCLLVSITVSTNRISHFLAWKPLVWVGSFSYSLYLIHAPIIDFAFRFGWKALILSVPANLSVLFAFGILAPVIVLIGFGFYVVAEMPCVNYLAAKSFSAKASAESRSSGNLSLSRSSIAS